jgi:hypothetical protein
MHPLLHFFRHLLHFLHHLLHFFLLPLSCDGASFLYRAAETHLCEGVRPKRTSRFGRRSSAARSYALLAVEVSNVVLLASAPDTGNPLAQEVRTQAGSAWLQFLQDGLALRSASFVSAHGTGYHPPFPCVEQPSSPCWVRGAALGRRERRSFSSPTR